jgi:hypothetical protein
MTGLIFRECSQVRVRQLIEVNRPFNGSQNVMRPPEIGDTGIVVHITQHRWDGSLIYLVEKASPDGGTVWRADFVAEELASVHP